MLESFDFSTEEVLEEEIKAILAALDADALPLSAHARNETWLDGLTLEDLYDVISFYDEVSKDVPDNDLGRAPGLNFVRRLEDGRTALVKVGWNSRRGFYIIVTAMAN